MSDPLFSDMDPRPAEERPVPDTAPRYRPVNRRQLEFRISDVDRLLPEGHRARLVWEAVEQLPLEKFGEAVRARESHPGRSAIDPRVLVALWLYATIRGIGSARRLAELSEMHDAYRWLCAGEPISHHTLSDFRVEHRAALDELLTRTIAVLMHHDVVRMRRVAQDGMRVRASAGAASFRRRRTLEECLEVAREQVANTARQIDQDVSARRGAARKRAARERLARLEHAMKELPAVEATKARQAKRERPAVNDQDDSTPPAEGAAKPSKRPAEARVSTTDPEARVMKMGDGGFRPAYNVQFATDADSRVILGVGVTNVGSDKGELPPMLEQIEQRTGVRPAKYLADGGFVTGAVINAVAEKTVLYAPTQKPKNGRDAAVACRGDSPAEAEWRRRMATEEAKHIYRERASTAEWVNADARGHRTLNSFRVRGLDKVYSCALWVAVAHNLFRASRAGVSLAMT
jgi:transposase